ncbi:MAG: protein kinase [Lentisphaeria bacterium]|nr:protein kinase [Lentisphaeria bacterium]
MRCKFCGYTRDDDSAAPEKCPGCGAVISRLSALRSPGDMIGNFRILRRIGRGGSGDVYLCDNPVLMERCAVKVLNDSATAHDKVFVERLLREARIAAALQRPDVVAVLDAGVDEKTGEPYIVMEYVDGESLEDVLREGPLPENAVIGVALRVASVLLAAEELGIVHRDIKPGNILFTRSGDIKLADLGIAKSGTVTGDTISGSGIILGTPNYSAPEQLRNAGSVDIRADIYSLGATMYHMLTGVRPFEADTVFNTIAKVFETRMPPVSDCRKDISLRTSRLIEQMMAKNPENRIQNIASLIRALNKCMAHEKSSRGNWLRRLRFLRRDRLRLPQRRRVKSRMITPGMVVRDLFFCFAVLVCLVFSWFNFGRSYSERLRSQHSSNLEAERKREVKRLLDSKNSGELAAFVGRPETSDRSKLDIFTALLRNRDAHDLLLELISEGHFSGRNDGGYLGVACSVPNCREEIIEELIRSGAFIDRRDSRGRTPLMRALLAGNFAAVDILLNYGADPHYIDNSGRNIYFYLPAKFSRDLLETLKVNEVVLNSVDSGGRTPLMVYVDRFDSPEMVKLMVEHKFNINRRARNGETAFAISVRRRHIRSAEVLFNAGARFDSNELEQVSPEYRLRSWMEKKIMRKR